MDEHEIERLIRSEQSYRNLAECSGQGILVHGLDGEPLYANAAFARMLGYDSPAQILALDCVGEPLVAEHDRARLGAYMQARTTGSGAPEEVEFDALSREGALRRLRAQVATTNWQGRPAVLATMVDVTAQRAAEARFQALVEGSIHGIAILDVDWKPLFVNQAYATLFGYSSREEVLALDSVEALIAPDDVARMRGYARARRDGAAAPELYEFQGVCRDGRRRPLLSSARRIEWHDEPALQVTLTDLTELRVAERALRESEQRLAEANTMLHRVLDTIPDRVFWKDRDGRFLGCNHSFAADAGRKDPADLIGRTDDEMSWGEDSDKYRADDARVCETGEPMLGFEELQTRRDGSQFWVRTSKVALCNPAGDVIGILGTYRHITDEKRAQQALRASEERYALAVQGSTDGIWDWDIERGTIYYSPRLLEIAGFARGREIQSGEDVLASIHEEDRPGYRAALSAHLRGQTGVFRLEFRIRADDGTIRWVLDRGVALREPSGRAYRMAGSVVDITERRRADEELERYRGQLEVLVAERTAALRAAHTDLLRSGAARHARRTDRRGQPRAAQPARDDQRVLRDAASSIAAER